jgi:hypothetical protein
MFTRTYLQQHGVCDLSTTPTHIIPICLFQKVTQTQYLSPWPPRTCTLSFHYIKSAVWQRTHWSRMNISCKRYNKLIPLHVVALARRIGFWQATANVTLLLCQLPGLNILTKAELIVAVPSKRKQPALNQDRLHKSNEKHVLFQITIMTKVVTRRSRMFVLEEI